MSDKAIILGYNYIFIDSSVDTGSDVIWMGSYPDGYGSRVCTFSLSLLVV